MRSTLLLLTPLLVLALVPRVVLGHGGMDMDDNEAASVFNSTLMTDEPMDGVLWLHIVCMTVSFGILMPVGVVLALARRYQWHAWVQAAATGLAILGFIFGHAHGGRQFEPHSAHRSFAPYIMALVLIQVALGVYLKLPLNLGWLKAVSRVVRRPVKLMHRGIGLLLPLLGGIQIHLGVIVAMGFCYDYRTGPCFAHFLTGNAFVFYGAVCILLIRMGGDWLRRQERSPEYFDSLMVILVGLIHTFANRNWSRTEWNDGDEHTAMGIAALCAGVIGFVMAQGGKRTIFPAVAVIIIGISFTGHAQHGEAKLMSYSMAQHGMTGLLLLVAGVCRILELALEPKPTWGKFANAYYYVVPAALCSAGIMFMGSHDEQIEAIIRLDVASIAWINICFAFGFYAFLFTYLLADLWCRLTRFDERSSVLPTKAIDVSIADPQEGDLDELLVDSEQTSSSDAPSADSFELPIIKEHP